MDAFKAGWFTELSALWPGQSFSMEVEQVIHRERSRFQDILVLKTKSYGRALVLDGVIQCTERDEFSYQEMMAHVPITCHQQPENVLVIGGGDGGVVRELLKHDSIRRVELCEIDGAVIDTVKQHMPSMPAGCFDSDRVHVHNQDGRLFLKQKLAQYDVIITDSSDPIGPAVSLFEEEYFALVRDALRSGGILCCQAENMWLHQDVIRDVMASCRKYFKSVAYGYVCVPTYPGGQIGILLACKDKDIDFATPGTELSSSEMARMCLRYYTPAVHRAAFALPHFARAAFAATAPV